ncbi:hypothetical protein GS451_14925 [Rhodococcus hoagii]|nr:hypothetical protein [Prescottella equi]
MTNCASIQPTRARRLWHLKSEWFSAIAFVFLVPVVWDSADNQWKKVADHVVAGGNFAAGGSKFEDLVEELTGACFYGAVAVHDKISPFPR